MAVTAEKAEEREDGLPAGVSTGVGDRTFWGLAAMRQAHVLR